MKKAMYMRSQCLAAPLALCLPFIMEGAVSLGQKPASAKIGNSQAPVISMPMPLGIQRGTSMELSLTGTNLAGPTGLLTGFPAKVTILSMGTNGQDNSKVKVRLDVPADAPLGYYPLRLATTRGMSNLRLFCIDELPQVVEVEGNRAFEGAQRVSIPCVIAGRAAAESSAYFKVTVAAGQRVSFDVLGRRLGSPIDPQLSLYSASTRRALARDNDAPGCQTDARLTHVFKESGDYVIEVKDVLGRGGPDFVYRLRIGDFPVATVPIPMAAKRGSKTTIQFAGPQVEGVPAMHVAVPADPAVGVVWVAPKGRNGMSGWPVALAVTDMDEAVEQEPNNEPTQANRIAVPGGVTGRFEHVGDTDYYVFAARKGQKLTIEAQTLEWYSPTLIYMVLKNKKTNAAIAQSNPQSPPPGDQRIEFTAAEDGDFVLQVQHINYLGGPSEAYHVAIGPSLPDFDIALDSDRYDLAPDSFVPLALQVTRRGYTGPIYVHLHGPAQLLGGTTRVKSGQTTAGLLVAAQPETPLGPYSATLLATAVIDGKPVTHPVSARGAVSSALSGLPFPPLDLTNTIALAVKEKAPFALAMRMEPPEAVPGIATQVIVSATRAPGFAEEITLNPPAGLPANVPIPKATSIAKGKDRIKFKFDVNAKTPLGEYFVFLSGRAQTKGMEYTTSALPLALVVGQPFALNVEPAELDLKPGDKATVTITAQRKGGYVGPIAVEWRNLPANVTADKGTIALDRETLELQIVAAASAVPAEKKDVKVIGTATGLNNMQNASPAFTVRVLP